MAFPKRRGKTPRNQRLKPSKMVEFSMAFGPSQVKAINDPFMARGSQSWLPVLPSGKRLQKTMENPPLSCMGKSTISGRAFSIANCEITRGYFEVLFIMGLL